MHLVIAWRNIWRNKKRSIITITAIFIAVFLSILMRSMQLGMYDNMIKNVVGSYSGYIQIHKKGYWEKQTINNAFQANQKLLNEINKIDGVENTIMRLQSSSLASHNELTKYVFLSGIQPDKEEFLTNWNKRLIKGKLLKKGDNNINIGKGVSSFFNLTVGDSITFSCNNCNSTKYMISGIVDMKNPKLNKLSVFMNLESAQKILHSQNKITHIIIDKKEYSDETEISKKISNKIGQDYEVMNWKEMMPELEQTIQADSAGGIIMIFILYMIITFGIFGTVLMMTQERKYEFGVLISIGMKKTKLILILFYETIILSLIGVLLGILISRPIILYYYHNPLVMPSKEANAMEDMGFEAVIPFMNTYDIPLTHGLIIFTISVIICLYPAYVIYSLNPIKAMKR